MAKVQLTAVEQVHINRLVERLTPVELEVVKLVVAGGMNRTIAKELGVAVRTVESRRSRAMEALDVDSLPELIKVWLAYAGEFELIGQQVARNGGNE